VRIGPALAEMRRERAPRRRAQAAMMAAGEAWRAQPAVASLLADLERYGAGAALAECEALRAAFACAVKARELARSVAARFAAELAQSPLGQVPFRHGFDGQVSTLLLARGGKAQLILHAREPGEQESDVASFSSAERREVVLAGEGEGRIVRRDPLSGKLVVSPIALQAGIAIALDLEHEALHVRGVSRRLVTLRLHRFATDPEPSREYRLADGALLHQAAGDMRASRQEMMLTLLGRMGRAEAAPTMAEMAREPGDASLRWQALRECLALDTGEGFRALCDLARREDDPLAAPAGALRAQLVEAHPQLLALEDGRCPA